MSFLTPWFFAGLGLLAIPIIIHLTQRQRSKVTAFPSLMFLRKVPFKTTSRRRIRHPLLFVLRCLAIVLLALAFARPFFESEGVAATDASRDVVLVVDVSASLGHGDRWDAALDSARAALGELGEGDRVAVVSFAEEAEERLALTPDLVAAADALDGLAPTDLGTRLEAGLQLAGRALSESDRLRREVVLVSDFQRTGWDDAGRTRLPDGVDLRMASVAVDAGANVAVAEATIHEGGSGRARILARVANMGDEAVEALPVSLELGGRTVATIPADLAPRGAATVAFEDVAIPEGRSRGRVTIPSDALAVDDALRFLATADGGLEALILEAASGRADRSLFLERALGLGEAPTIRPARRPAGQLDAAWLATADVVIVNDADLADAGRAGRLRDWVAGGGGLLLALGSGADPAAWSEAGRALLGGTSGPVEDRSESGGGRLAWLDYDHPAFELFSAPRSGDFSVARFFRYRVLDPGPAARVLARFDDGRPALLEHVVGEGRVLVWTSTLDRFWNDLAVQPVYLPFIHRLVRHATGYREAERWVRTGGVRELADLTTGIRAEAADEEEAWVLVTPDGERRPIETAEGPTWIAFDRAGFYRVEALDDPGRAVTVAANPALEESDLTPVAAERVAAAVLGADAALAGEDPGAEDAAAAAAGPGGDGGAAASRRAELWWPLVLLAVLVLAAESLIANRWTRRRPASRLAQT